MAQRRWNRPVPHTLLPRRQHDLARIDDFDAGGALHRRSEQTASGGRDLNDLAIIAHGNADEAPEPEQKVGPKRARGQGELAPIVLPPTRLLPGLGWHAPDIAITGR